jgi:DNA-binding transcriptional MerR regulator
VPARPEALAPESPADADLTIEQLAAETGISVRNLRSHRARGLLQAPIVRKRVGYYGREHVARVQLIQRLQDEGLNLGGISKLLNLAGTQPSVLLGLMHAASVPVHAEQAEVLTRQDLRDRLDLADDDEAALSQALELGVLEVEDEDRDLYRAPAPSLLVAAAQVMSFGVPLHHALAVVGKVQKQCDEIAAQFLRLYLDDVWGPFKQDDFPKDGWQRVTDAIDTLRPLSSQVVLACYGLRIDRAIEREIPREFGRLLRRAR